MTTNDGSVHGSTQIVDNATPFHAFNVVVLSEGYQVGELAQFAADAQTFADILLDTAPYKQLRSHINVYRVDVSSTDSGADDPEAKTTASTYFDASFNGLDGTRDHRVLESLSTTALATAFAHVPLYTVVMVMVNSTVYGGSGGGGNPLATFSLGVDGNGIGAHEIGLHEMGHASFGFADEYDFLNSLTDAEPGQEHYPGLVEPGEPNVTINTNRATLKWRGLVAAATPLPTSANPDCAKRNSTADPLPGAVGLYEGAHYYHCGIYRPQQTCRMFALGIPFCAVCQDTIISKFAPYRQQITQPNARVTVTASQPSSLDLFTVSDDQRVMWTHGAPSVGWSEWSQINHGTVSNGSSVTALARVANQTDVFVVGSDGHPYTIASDPVTGWTNWREIGSVTMRPGSVINVVSRTPDSIDLVGVRDNDAIISAFFTTTDGWSDWSQVNGGAAGPGAEVTAAARNSNVFDVFTVGGDGQVWTIRWDRFGGWGPWSALPGVTGATVVTSETTKTPGHTDLFTVAGDGRVMSTHKDESTGWALDWFHISDGFAKPGTLVTAITRPGIGDLDLFTVASDGRMMSTWWNAVDGWANWFHVAGGTSAPTAHLTAIAPTADHIDVFGIGVDNNVWNTWWDASGGWQPGWALVT